MKYFIALLALVAVASANPLPLVQIIVNIDAPESVGAAPASVGESPAIADLPILDFVPEEPSYNPIPLPVPQPTPVEIPEPVVLPEPIMPVLPSPEPIVVPQPEVPSVPISPIVIQPTPIAIENPIDIILN